MTPIARFIFDENIPPSIVDDLANLLRNAQDEETAQVKHVHALYQELGLNSTQGNWDEVWIPSLATDQWLVIAGDRGKKAGKGKKLPHLCAHYGITHVLLSPVVHHRRKFKKLLTILSVWHELVGIYNGQKGLRFFIEPASTSIQTHGRGKLVQKAIPIPQATPKGMLFPK